MIYVLLRSFFFFFNDTATTEIYTLSLHDALPISAGGNPVTLASGNCSKMRPPLLFTTTTTTGTPVRPASARPVRSCRDRKSTRLNSSHGYISYAVFCLKKKKQSQAHHLDVDRRRL